MNPCRVLMTVWSTDSDMCLSLTAPLLTELGALAVLNHFEFQNAQYTLHLSEFSNACPSPHLPGELLSFQAFSDNLLFLGVLVFLRGLNMYLSEPL